MRRRAPLALAAATAMLIAGCATDDPTDEPPPAADENFPVTVGEVTLEEQPTRIVSLSPAATEMLFAIDAGEQVVAADEFSSYPPEAPTTELSGFDLNVEALADYDPDLVVISSFAGDIVPQLEQLEIPAYLAPDDPATLEDVYVQIVDLGMLTGHPTEADDLVEQMSSDIAELVADTPERAEPLTYYIEIDDTYWTYTSDSLVGSLFEMVGLENVAGSPGEVSTQLSAEVLVDANPDFIFLANTAYGVDAATVADRDGWSQIEAVQSDQIVELDTDIASRWGPRIVDLLEAVVDAVTQVP